MRGRFVPASQVTVVARGAAELFERVLTRGDPLPPPLAIREPELDDLAWFLVLDATARDALVAAVRSSHGGPGPKWLQSEGGLVRAIAVSSPEHAKGEPAAVVTDQGLAGVVVPAPRWSPRERLTRLTERFGFRRRQEEYGYRYRGDGFDPRPSAPAREGDVLEHVESSRSTARGDVAGTAPLPQPPQPPPIPARAVEPVIRRTPHLEAPDEVAAERGHTFAVAVWTDRAPARSVEESEDVVVEAPPEVTSIEFHVTLSATPHVRVRGDATKRLTIDRREDDSDRVPFTLEVVDPQAEGPLGVVVQFLRDGRPNGRVGRRWSWPDGRTIPAEEDLTPTRTHLTDCVPDLTVSIVDPSGMGTEFTCSVQAPSLPGYENPTAPVPWGPGADVEGFVSSKLSALVTRTNDEAARRLTLLDAGRAFWNAAPKPFQKALWALVDERERTGATGRARIFVASDEPILPWEIMLPSRLGDDGFTEVDRAAPLGVEFALGRWVRGDAESPPPVLPVTDSFVIAPRYAPERALDATSEVEVLARHYGGRKLAEASFAYLDGFLAANDASLLHFVCHGVVRDGMGTLFLDDDAACTHAQIRESAGFRAACADRHPVVFINACEAGQAAETLGPGGAGFPRVFSQLGARAIIAPLWPVTKFNAPVVAKEIYEQAAAEEDRTLADVMADLRARSYAKEGPFDDSWAAYCLFGDPCAKLVRDA